MNTCKTCKHWTGFVNRFTGLHEEPVLTTAAGQSFLQGTCRRVDEHAFLQFANDAFVDAADDYDLELITGQDFGCTLHEPKP